MNYQRDLKISLQERYKRLYKAPHHTYEAELRYFRDFIQEKAALRRLVEGIAASEPSFDPIDWISKNARKRGRFDWPETEPARAKLVWTIFNRLVDGPDTSQGWSELFSFESNLNAAHRELTERVFEPFVEYLQSKLSDAGELLHLLERYKRRVEWFEQTRLHEAYKSDTKRGEKIYDTDLRKFLFEQGIDYPFSAPVSPSGRADILANIDNEDPLVCEVKLYDAGQYSVPYVAKGFKQAVRYARDYHKVFGHLLIFNLSAETLDLPTDDASKAWPPRLEVGGHIIYMVVVQALPLESASTRGKLEPRRVSKHDLVGEETDAEDR